MCLLATMTCVYEQKGEQHQCAGHGAWCNKRGNIMGAHHTYGSWGAAYGGTACGGKVCPSKSTGWRAARLLRFTPQSPSPQWPIKDTLFSLLYTSKSLSTITSHAPKPDIFFMHILRLCLYLPGCPTDASSPLPDYEGHITTIPPPEEV